LYFNFLNLHISWSFTPTSFTILNEPNIFNFNNPCTMDKAIKYIPFWFLWIINEISNNCSYIQFIFLWIVYSNLCLTTPNMQVSQVGFPTCPQFKRYLNCLIGTLFNIYMTIFKAHIHNDTCKMNYLTRF